MKIIIVCDDNNEVLPNKFAGLADVVTRGTRVVKNVDGVAESLLFDVLYALRQPQAKVRA